MLRDEGSALDLMLRGFDRAMVLDRTGIDIGYNGRRLRGQVAGIDRTAYKIEHVRRRVDTSAVDRALTLVEEGRPREDVLAGLGLAGPDSITLAKLFDGLGLGDRFAAARAVGRRKTLQEGMVAAHGVANAFQLPEVQRRSAQVRTKRYGAPYTLAAGSSLAAGARAMMRTGATVRDDLVESVRSRLVQRYGATDVMVDAGGDARYPFGCTLRVVSHDVFVEVIDRGALSQDRREAAARAGIDLVVLRRCAKGQDADLWFALGCPVGRDWERDHSWIGDRVFDSLRVELSWPRVLTGSVGISRKAARAANAGVFYARELALWERDPMTPKGSVRGRLLCNRHHYLGKLPDQLSDLELLRGMRVSGLVDGYTAFDNSGMVAVLQQYRPSSVYDPCAGWGERLATCAGLGFGYFGVDINEEVIMGHQQIVARYGLTGQTTMVADAARFDARGRDHELVFTCPPYGSTEIYTGHGAENLDEAGFLDWWARVCTMAVGPCTETFAYQINQAWRDRMNAVLVAQGWKLVDRIDVGRHAVSHFNRDAGGAVHKQEFEQVQVFVR